MGNLTPLERAILAEFREPAALAALLATARVSEREVTGPGFYTTLEVDRTLPPVDSHAMIDGPVAHLIGREAHDVVASILWLDNGYPITLEGFQYGDFDLRTVDVAALQVDRIEWPELRQV